MPISAGTLALFIAYLFERHYASSTVYTYVACLSHTHKLRGFADPAQVFYIKQMLKGYNKRQPRLDLRLPITLPILQRLINASNQISGSPYQACQFRAMCALAFFAFLRIGEITTHSGAGNLPLQLNQLTKVYDGRNRVSGIQLTFSNFKHHYNERPFTLLINVQPDVCPVALLLDYLALRGEHPGAIFVTQLGIPVSRDEFSSRLQTAVRYCGLDSSRYKGHSFRIGAASHAAEQGMSDARIRILGRWNSNAFHKYIRVNSFNV